MRSEREVIFIGICGPSASGKGSVAGPLADALNSPIIPIQADWFFKVQKPPCGRELHCCELTSSVDSYLFTKTLEKISTDLKEADTVPCLTINILSRNRGETKDVQKKVGAPLGSIIYIVVEGFVLFADPDLVELFQHCIWFDMQFEIGCMRRYSRQGKPLPMDDSNPVFVQYRDSFYKHVWDHHVEFRDRQLTIAEDKIRARIDANQPLNEVICQTIAVVREALKTPTTHNASVHVEGQTGHEELLRLWKQVGVLGKEAEAQRDWIVATKHYAECVRLRPDHENGYLVWGRSLQKQGDTTMAIHVLEQGIAAASSSDKLKQYLEKLTAGNMQSDGTKET